MCCAMQQLCKIRKPKEIAAKKQGEPIASPVAPWRALQPLQEKISLASITALLQALQDLGPCIKNRLCP